MKWEDDEILQAINFVVFLLERSLCGVGHGVLILGVTKLALEFGVSERLIELR